MSYDTCLCKHKPQINLISPRNQKNYLLSNWQGGSPQFISKFEQCTTPNNCNWGSESHQKRTDLIYSMIKKLESKNNKAILEEPISIDSGNIIHILFRLSISNDTKI